MIDNHTVLRACIASIQAEDVVSRDPYELFIRVATPRVQRSIGRVMVDGAAKHPDVEEGRPVDEEHELVKILSHIFRAFGKTRDADGYARMLVSEIKVLGKLPWHENDPDSGEDHMAHAAMRCLKVLKGRLEE